MLSNKTLHLSVADARLVAAELYKLLRGEGLLPEQMERFIRIEEAARILGRSTSWVRHHINELPHSKSGKYLYFTRKSLDDYITQNYLR